MLVVLPRHHLIMVPTTLISDRTLLVPTEPTPESSARSPRSLALATLTTLMMLTGLTLTRPLHRHLTTATVVYRRPLLIRLELMLITMLSDTTLLVVLLSVATVSVEPLRGLSLPRTINLTPRHLHPMVMVLPTSRDGLVMVL